jgi:hypothetical protein
MEWKYPTLPVKRRFRTQLMAGKVMLALFWDAQGPVLAHYEESSTTVNSVYYSEMLWDWLKPTV